MALFTVRTNSRWRPPPSWIISNGHVSATAHDLLILRASHGHFCDSTAFLLGFVTAACRRPPAPIFGRRRAPGLPMPGSAYH